MVIETMKRCTSCGEEKPLEDFRRERLGKYGRQARCRECKAAAQRERHAERGGHTEKKRKWEAENRERLKASKARYSARNPGKRDAKRLVWNALRRGDLVRPNSCSECGLACTPQAHHEDYSKPLVVTWLCVDCHKKRHRGARHG